MRFTKVKGMKMTIFAKKSMFKKSMLVALMGTSLLLAACNDDKDDNSHPSLSIIQRTILMSLFIKKMMVAHWIA